MRKGVKKKKKMKKGLTMLVAAMVIFGLVCVIGSAAAADYIWVESNVKGIGYKNAEYEVQTRAGLSDGIKMQELESGTGLVTKQKWTLEVNPEVDDGEGTICVEGLIETKEFDVEYFPFTYQNHSYDQKWMEKKCVKNYEIGAVTDANFVQCEKLQKKESVETYTGYAIWEGEFVEIDDSLAPKSLVQTVSADLLGISHIGFAAKEVEDPHHTIAYGKEETIGQFNIQKTIEIRETCDVGLIGDWLGCP